MGNKINDPIARLMGLRYKSHPWHGVEVGDNAPDVITAFIEMVPTDTVKYELDKVSGYLKIASLSHPVEWPHGPRQQGLGEGREQARTPSGTNTSQIILHLWSVSQC